MKSEKSPHSFPTAMTIAGSDSGGGAGIQADLKTFAALRVHGTSVVTCVTAQNPRRVKGIEPCSASIVARQLEAVFEELPPAAAKTGMLYSEQIIREVSGFFRTRRIPLIVDPVMIATSGAPLLQSAASKVLCSQLLPLATLITPNLDEAGALLGRPLTSVGDLRSAAKTLHARFGAAMLVKGGHLRGVRQAVDIFYDGTEELLLTAPFIRGINTHGTGCTYSAAITASLASGLTLPASVAAAKEFVTQAIAQSAQVGSHKVLNNLWRVRRGGKR